MKSHLRPLKWLEWLLEKKWIRFFVAPLLVIGVSVLAGCGVAAVNFWDALDRASSIAGLLSISFAWPVGFYLWARRTRATYDVHQGLSASRLKGVFMASLILVSRRQQPEWHMRNLCPKHAEFIWTPQSASVANELIQTFKEVTQIRFGDTDQTVLENSTDIEQARDACGLRLRALVDEFGAENVCIDVTGGTAVMSLAAFQVAEELAVTSIYLRGNTIHNGNPIIDKPDDPGNATVILLSNRTGKNY